ncbi:MAG: nitrilase-related carbon-nitrogen hydrolase [Verrucomicrobiales bacterium]
MRVIGVQIDIAWEDKAENFRRVRAVLAAAGAIPPGSLIVLPELFATGFSMDAARITKGEPGETDRFLEEIAADYASAVVAGMAVRAGDAYYNTAQVVEFGGPSACEYRKIRPFTGAGEGDAYAAGTAVAVAEVFGWKVCPTVCYDLRFPEIYREGLRAGAEIFACVANWPVARIDHWIALLRARAIENQAYLVGVNRVGEDPRFRYVGRSLIVDPHGRILADAGAAPGAIAADLDRGAFEAWRRDFPAVRDFLGR